MVPFPVIVLALSGCLSVCALVFSLTGNRTGRATAQIALLLAALIVPAGIAHDWFLFWNKAAKTQSKAAAFGMMIADAMNYWAIALVPAMVATLAWKRMASNLKRKRAG